MGERTDDEMSWRVEQRAEGSQETYVASVRDTEPLAASDEGDSPEEIREDIEQTRSAMS